MGGGGRWVVGRLPCPWATSRLVSVKRCPLSTCKVMVFCVCDVVRKQKKPRVLTGRPRGCLHLVESSEGAEFPYGLPPASRASNRLIMEILGDMRRFPGARTTKTLVRPTGGVKTSGSGEFSAFPAKVRQMARSSGDRRLNRPRVRAIPAARSHTVRAGRHWHRRRRFSSPRE